MALKETLEKVEQDLAEGKLGLARDRLHGLLLSYPGNAEVRSQLGDVYWQLGYPHHAGRFWIFDWPLNDQKRSAIDSFMLDCDRNPAAALKRLKLRGCGELIADPSSGKRVRDLIEECKRRGIELPDFDAEKPEWPEEPPPKSSAWAAWGCCIGGFVVVGLAVIGLVAVSNWLEELLKR